MCQPHTKVCLDYIPILKYIVLKFFHLIFNLGIIGENSEQVLHEIVFHHPPDGKGGMWSPQQFLMIWLKSILNNPCSGFELTEFQFVL